jgi:hypothetical protein
MDTTLDIVKRIVGNAEPATVSITRHPNYQYSEQTISGFSNSPVPAKSNGTRTFVQVSWDIIEEETPSDAQ